MLKQKAATVNVVSGPSTGPGIPSQGPQGQGQGQTPTQANAQTGACIGTVPTTYK